MIAGSNEDAINTDVFETVQTKQFEVSKTKDIWSNCYQIDDKSKSILVVTESINPISSLMNKGKGGESG